MWYYFCRLTSVQLLIMRVFKFKREGIVNIKARQNKYISQKILNFFHHLWKDGKVTIKLRLHTEISDEYFWLRGKKIIPYKNVVNSFAHILWPIVGEFNIVERSFHNGFHIFPEEWRTHSPHEKSTTVSHNKKLGR